MVSKFALPDPSRRLLRNNRLLAKVRSRRLSPNEIVKSDVYQYRKKLRLKRTINNDTYRRLVKVRGKRGMFWRSQLVSQTANRNKQIGAMAQNVQQKLSAIPAKPNIRTAGWNAQPITKFREIGLADRVPKIATPPPITAKGNGRGVAILTGLSLLGTVGTAGLYLNRGDKK